MCVIIYFNAFRFAYTLQRFKASPFKVVCKCQLKTASTKCMLLLLTKYSNETFNNDTYEDFANKGSMAWVGAWWFAHILSCGA